MAELPVVTLYARQGCHLCDEALGFLHHLSRRLAFRVEVVDIESDDDLLRRYLFEIPVVSFSGNEIAKAPIRRKALEDALLAALEGRRV